MINNYNCERLNKSSSEEVLFWKVFGNVYLLKLIFHHIHTTEWVVYEAYKKINVQNRWKFKDVYSLDWMILKKQYPLLINKIKFGDFILFDTISIKVLFSAIPKLKKQPPITTTTTTKPTSSSTTKTLTLKAVKEKEKEEKRKEIEKEIENEKEIETLKYIIILLLEKRRLEFEICDLTQLAVKSNCLDTLSLLLCEQYSTIVYPSTLEWAIENCDSSIVKQLLTYNNKQLLTEDIKKKALFLASINTDYQNEMINLILDESLYKLPPPPTPPPPPPPPTSSSSLQHQKQTDQLSKNQNKKIKPDSNSDYKIHYGNDENDNDDDDNDDDNDDYIFGDHYEEDNRDILNSYYDDYFGNYEKLSEIERERVTEYPYINFENFLTITSIDTMNKLMDLKVVKPIARLHNQMNLFKFEFSLKQLLVYLRIYLSLYKKDYYFYSKLYETLEIKINNEIINNEKLDQSAKLKELRRLVVIHSRQETFYKQYILYYEESIDEFHRDLQYDRIDSSNLDSDCKKFLALLRYMGEFVTDKMPNRHKYYLEDLKKMKSSTSNDRWCPLLFKAIECFPGQLENFNITDKSIIDWIKNTNSIVINTAVCTSFTMVSYSLIELKHYAITQAFTNLDMEDNKKSLSYFFKKNWFVKFYLKELEFCNVERLQEIEDFLTKNCLENSSSPISINVDSYGSFDFKIDQQQQQQQQQPNQNIVDDQFDSDVFEKKIVGLIEYLNKSNFKFIQYGMHVFLKKVIEHLPREISSNLVVNLNPVKFYVNSWLTASIITLNLKMVEFLINNLEAIEFEEQDFTRIQSVERNLFNSSLNVYHNHDEILVFDFVMSIFQTIVNKWGKCTVNNNQKEGGGGGSGGGGTIKSLPESCIVILNYFFEMIIQTKYITIEQVRKAHQFLCLNSIPIKHSLFHAFYYLKIRSAKFIKYILSRPGIEAFFDVTMDSRYNSTREYFTERCFDIRDHLKYEMFTFDYVLGCEGTSGGASSSSTTASFDEILQNLFDQLSNDICFKENIVHNFYQLSKNADLSFCLDIRRVDLFFKHLDIIQSHLKDTTSENYVLKSNDPFPIQEYSYNSPMTTILPTSQLFSGREFPEPYLPFCERNTIQYDHCIFKPLTIINSFDYSEKVLDLIFMVITDLELIQKFLEYNFHVIQFEDTLFSKSLHWSRFDISTFLLNNFDIQFFSFPRFALDTHYSFYQETVFILNNHFDKVRHPNKFKYDLNVFNDTTFPIAFLSVLIDFLSNRKNSNHYEKFMNIETRKDALIKLLRIQRDTYGAPNTDDDMDADDTNIETSFQKEKQCRAILIQPEAQSLLKSIYDDFKIELDKKREKEKLLGETEYLDSDDNLFLSAFIVGDIKLCDLLLCHYYHPIQFKITKSAITKAIKDQKIHIIKYYYNGHHLNLLNNNIKNDKNLSDHLLKELLNHNDYKFDLNWL
ncbi:hypothetical protein ACTFIY_004201 [Dictyostelium cf. discoideum]